MHVVVDFGNTRIKWARVEDGKLAERGQAVHRDGLEPALAVFEAALPAAPERVLVSNVAGPAVAQRLTDLVRRRSGVAPELVATTSERLGVRCAYPEPARLGVDRWIAVLAAHHLAAGRPACVIDAGTAATFDAVDANGQHLGGLIFAGAHLLVAALARDTSDIGAMRAFAPPAAGLALLATNTEAAVGRGAMLALAAAFDRALRTVEEALGAPPAVYLTGGDAAALQGWLETEVKLRADLVLEGLALLALEPLAAPPKGAHA